MEILKSLMGNKSLLSGALGMLRNAFFKDGISAVFITPSDDQGGDTPGMSIRSFNVPVAILAGEDLEEVQSYFKIKSLYSAAPGYFLFMDGRLTYFPNSIEAAEAAGLLEKEADRV